MFGKSKTKVKAVFLKKLGENNFEIKSEKNLNMSYEELDTKSVKDTDEFISYEGKSFPIPRGIFTLKTGKTIKIFYDYENEKILCFKQHSCLINAEWLDQLLHKKLIAQLVSAVKKGMETTTGNKTILQFIFVGIVCIVIGYFIGTTYS